MADKGDYQHFMMKEIMDQKETITKAINLDTEKIMEVAKKLRAHMEHILWVVERQEKLQWLENICLAKLQKACECEIRL